MHFFLAVVTGLLAGPLIHHVAVQAGRDAPFSMASSACRGCDAPSSTAAPCRRCGRRPVRAWLTSAAMAALCGGFAWAIGPAWTLAAHVLFAGVSVALFITDLDHKRIPNRITYPMTPVLAVALMGAAALDGWLAALPRALLGAVAYSGIFLVVFLIARGGFGFGDVKLAVPLGLFTTFWGWERLLAAGMVTAGIGGIVALVVLVTGRGTSGTEIPYGPPMILGSWAAILLG